MPRILSVGTAVPPYRIAQRDVKEFARKLFLGSIDQLDRLLPIFEHTGIEQRCLSRPLSWFQEEHTWKEKNDAYIETACQIGEQAIRNCLQAVDVTFDEIDHLIFVSTTGMATPTVDAYLINRLRMGKQIKRTPLWGLGCAGGVVGLARAYESAKAFPTSKVLLLAVECCSLTFRLNDHSKSNLVATSLFSDGAAAVLVVGEQAHSSHRGPDLVGTMSLLLPNSLDLMGWDICDDGLRVVFSKDIPTVVHRKMNNIIEEFLISVDLRIDQIDRMITHPGGMKVLQAYQLALSVDQEKFRHSYEVLRQYGNMSSVTVLFVLARELAEQHQINDYGLVSALGPGFSAELAMLQWS